ncbi:MAG: hypothetical protein AB8G95_19530 [Anaerolineae bacterium]
MKTETNFALIGDYSPDVTAHQAIPKALEAAGTAIGTRINYTWIDTVNLVGNVSDMLNSYDGIWVVPASPYQNMDGAIEAIRHARESDTPFFGSCGGYQHAVLEFARNALGMVDADNAEVNPNTDFPLISPLMCALVEADGEIKLAEGSRARELHGRDTITEQYRCSYGFNATYLHLFENTDLQITGHDQDNDPRIIELKGHRFFVGTAYQPERSALRGESHPLITEYVKQASQVIA